MKSSLRRRFLAVALLSVITCAVALIALARILSFSHAQRVERARDAVSHELAVLRREVPAASPGLPRATTMLGMRGGLVASAAAFDDPALELDPVSRSELKHGLESAAASPEAAVRDEEISDEVLVVGVSRAPNATFAWVTYAVRPPSFALAWRIIVVVLTVATTLLVATAMQAVVSVQRGAASLNAALAALATDLSAPVPRPEFSELGEVRDGIAGLAEALARAQVDKERLAGELARRERLAALGRVAAGVAHEVRNPLASIKLRVDLGRRRVTTPPELARELASVSDEITRLDRLVADLLVVAGRRTGPLISTALGSLVERRVALLRPWADERGVRIEVTGEATSDLDVDAVARAVDNLVRNAVEASPREATVAVEVRTFAEAARVEVRDAGQGVDPARLHELFEPFFTTKPEGMGLGLALSQAIAAAHDGALRYERRDRLTCFELVFPRVRRAAVVEGLS
ncbi:MAG: ATP-binding protein [Byssovorax sp.]